MEPVDAAREVADSASACATVLVRIAAPKFLPLLREELPEGDALAHLRAMFERFATAAATFREHGGEFGSVERFTRAASSVKKLPSKLTGWDPRQEAPPFPLVEAARASLRAFGIAEPAEGWEEVAPGPREPGATD